MNQDILDSPESGILASTPAFQSFSGSPVPELRVSEPMLLAMRNSLFW